MSYHDKSCRLRTRRKGHEIWSTHLFHPVYRVVYGVSPIEPDGLSHGHWTQSDLWCGYHTDIGHRCKEMTFNLYRVVYDVSPMEPDGLSHGHWTQMQGDDF